MMDKVKKRHILIFILFLIMFMIIPISFAEDVSSLNQTNEEIISIGDESPIAIDESSEIMGDSQKEIYVSPSGDDDSGYGTQDSPYKTLEKAVDESNAGINTIFMANGTYNEYGLFIGKNINIIGSGNTIIDADGGGRIFRLTANVNFTLSDLTIQNVNESQYGGVICIRESGITILDANLMVNNVKFINIYSGYSGGAIYNVGGATVGGRQNNVSITNCEFINCGSKNNGVILTQSSTLIANCTFINSKCYSSTSTSVGSSIAIMGTSTATNVINITGCTFIGDSFNKGPGGAIYSSANMIDSVYINNNVFLLQNGYGVYASSNNSAILINANNNWWGTNNPNLTNLVNNQNIKINSYATLNISAESEIIDIYEQDPINVAFYNSDDNAKNTLIPLRNITLTSTGGELDTNPTSFMGEVTTNFSSETFGQYTITAEVDGEKVSTDVLVRDLTDKTIIVANSEVNYKDVIISVNVAPKSVTGNVTFTINDKKETIDLTNGKGNITLYNLPIAEYDNIILTYNGDADHNKSNTTISFIVFEKYPATLTTESIVDESSVTICAEVAPSDAKGNVTFTLNGNDEVIYLNEGKGNITISNLPNKDYIVGLTYNGDDNYQTDIDVNNFTILNRNPTELSITPVVVDDNVTIYAKINETLATGNVTFTLRYKTQVIELTNGEGNITVTGVQNDVYNLTFTYTGDIDYEPSNTTETFTVSVRKDTILTAEASVKNQVVIIDADINYYTASGNVTFTINGEDKIINITKSKGSITLKDVDFGNYSILLTYNGDINYNPSNYTLTFEVIKYDYGKILYVSIDGDDVNNGSENAPLKTISKAVDVANNFPIVEKIYIYSGVYTDSDMTIERSLDIEGESEDNTIIDAQGGFLFEIYGLENNVTFTNLTFKNGYNENGGAIRDYGYVLNVTDCTFINNTASDQGGAIYHYYGMANIENSVFQENIAITGGALYVSSYTDLTVVNDCEFIQNNALSGIYAGGAIYNAGYLQVNASIFTGNKAASKSNSTYDISGGDGGAIYNSNLLFVNNSEFTSNSAYYWGGAIKAGGYTYIYDSNFTDNSAGSRGGAIQSTGSGSYSAWTTLISGCNFDSNLIGRSAYEGSTFTGGAICAESPTAIRYSNFTNNYAYDGGAIFMRSNAKYIDYCNFINNTAMNGGAVVNNRSMSIISNSLFEENMASLGGAIYVYASNSISEDSFSNLTANKFVSNVADNGGAIYSNAGYASPQEINVEYSEFINNVAETGSAITTTNRANIEYNAIICDIRSKDVINVAEECEGIVSLENNWWGINNPNLNNIIVGISTPETYAVLNLTASKQVISNDESSTILAKLLWNDGTNNEIELIPQRNITLKTSNANLTNVKGVLNPEFTSDFSSMINGTYRITAYVDNEQLSIYVVVNEESEVPKENMTLYVDNVEITEGEVARIVVYLTEYASGNVSINGITSPVSDATAILEIPDLTYGNYTFDVVYSGDLNYNAAATTVNITVNPNVKKNATIKVNDVVINEGEQAKVIVYIDNDATGTITVKDKTATIRKGSATVIFNDLTVGNYTFDVTYSGDLRYNGAQSSVNVTVKSGQPKKDPSIEIDAPDITQGENATITITLPSDATGNVTVKDITVPIQDGIAVLSIPNLPAGRNKLEVIYSGDDNYNEVQTSVIVKVKRDLTNAIYANASTGSDELGNGSKDNPVKTIYKALTIAGENGTIVLTGTFKGNLNTELYLSSYINNVTFVGMDGAVIDGEHKHFLISITDGQFNFVELTFKNAYSSGYGAALINQAGYLTVEDCTFVDNIAQGSAAIDNTAILFVTNCTFIDNIATVYDGGAISSSWEAYIVNSTFTSNRAYQNGGAIKNYEEGYMYIEDCVFRDNIATGSTKGSYGGAVYSWSSDLEIYMSVFENNLANTKGGAVYSSYGNSFYDWYTYIQMSEFKGNEAPSGSTLFLELVTGEVSYNAFLDDSNVVYTYRNLTTLDNNWWGVNNPDWSSLLSGTIREPNSYAVLNVSAIPDNITTDSKSRLDYIFYWNGTVDSQDISLIPIRSIELSSNGGKLRDLSGYLTKGKFSTEFSSDNGGIYEIKAYVDNEEITIKVNVEGEPSTPKENLTIEATADVITVGENATIVVSGLENATGNVTVEVGDSVYTAPIVNGTVTVVVPGLVENVTATVTYDGDDKYNNASTTVDIVVNPKSKENATMNVDAPEVTEGENATVTVTLPEDATGTVTVGNETVPVVNGTATVTISNLPVGNTTLPVVYSGDDKYNAIEDSVTITVDEKEQIIVVEAPNVTKYYKGSERFVVSVKDGEGNPVANQNVSILLNGIIYSRTTNVNGTVSVGLGLNSGNYSATVTVNDTTVTSSITILSTVNGTDVVKVFRNATQYYATFRDSEGNYLAEGTEIEFNINGVFYTRIVRENGMAKLNLNLEQGNYVITAINSVTGENAANNITIIARIVNNTDLTKFYRNASQYVVTVLGDDGKVAKAGEVVTFNINGVFYNRTVNASGQAKLNINLQPGDYVVTAEYKGCKVSNNITVKPILSAVDLTKKYGTSDPFIANLVDGQGKPLAGEKITFNINGIFYDRTTNDNGQAKLNIRLQAGEYIITSSYNGANIANKVTVTA